MAAFCPLDDREPNRAPPLSTKRGNRRLRCLMDAILRGVDHVELDQTAVATVAPDLAIGLSRGRHPKTYRYVDPNEDVVAVHREDGATVLMVADGHNGHQVSHAAVDLMRDALAAEVPAWTRHGAVRAFHELNEEVRAVRRTLEPPNRSARTTLVVAVVTTNSDGQRCLVHASVGDSAVFTIRNKTVTQLSKDRQHFLGDRLSPPQVAGAMHYGQTDLHADDVVIVVSDGFTNFARPQDLSHLIGPDPEQTVRRIIDRAGKAGAGDNIAVAALLGDTTRGDAGVQDDRT